MMCNDHLLLKSKSRVFFLFTRRRSGEEEEEKRVLQLGKHLNGTFACIC
jgi:hypothetical protein